MRCKRNFYFWQTAPWTNHGLAAVVFFWICLAVVFPLQSSAGDPAYSVEVRRDQHLGFYLVNRDQMTLYISEADELNRSHCKRNCRRRWLPYVLHPDEGLVVPAELAASLGLIEAGDGMRQIAYRGKPLYLWHMDRAPGDVKGQGRGKPGKRRRVAGIEPAVRVRTDGGKTWLAGPDGMTLYRMVTEKSSIGKCTEGCAMNWPPLVVGTTRPAGDPGLEGEIGTMKRLPPDNRMQVTYKGNPLYYWSRDKRPGDTTGNGIGEIWIMAEP